MRVSGETVGSIAAGLCILVSMGPDDDTTTAQRLAGRIATLRVFPDPEGRMNRDLAAAGGAALVISQFTLHADTSHGHRPSFLRAASPEHAQQLCEAFVAALEALGRPVETGRFGAHMEVELVNHGPVTLVLSSGEPDWPADAG